MEPGLRASHNSGRIFVLRRGSRRKRCRPAAEAQQMAEELSNPASVVVRRVVQEQVERTPLDHLSREWASKARPAVRRQVRELERPRVAVVLKVRRRKPARPWRLQELTQ